jgi:HAD superfamily hydrolase (TIGR01509 family)
MKKAYIFDLDGTLVDSMGRGWSVIFRFLDERGVKYPSDLVKRVITLGIPGIAKYYKEHFTLKESSEEILEYFLTNMRVLYETNIPLKETVKETLIALKAQGHSLNVLTASPHIFLDPAITRLGVADLFDNAWTIEDFGITKADPRIYQMAAERLGLPYENCIMVDDSIGAIKTANAAGLQTIGVYDDFSKDYVDEMKAHANKYVYKFSEML